MSKEMLLIFVLCIGLNVALSCNEGELYPAPYSCEEYNECVNGHLTRRQCRLGEYFDGKKCDYLWKVDCNEAICPEGEFSKIGHCVQDYELCFLGKITKLSCPNGYSFNGQKCIEENSCKGKSSENKVEAPTAMKTMTNVQDKQCEDGETINHPTDCTMYELCVDGQWTDKPCPMWKHFDIKTLECTYYDYTCSFGGPCNDGETRSVYGRCTEYQNCTKNRWTKMSCDKDTYFQDGSCQSKPCPLRPVLNNCTNFMEPGSDKQYVCPAQQLFDKIERQCVRKTDATCLEGECEDGDKTYLATDCKKYQLCVNSSWTEQSCPWLRHFDAITKECNYYSYTCGQDIPTTSALPITTNPTDDPVQDKCDTENDKRGVRGDCHRYQVCKGGQWKDDKCNVWGKYDTATRECFYFEMWKVNCY